MVGDLPYMKQSPPFRSGRRTYAFREKKNAVQFEYIKVRYSACPSRDSARYGMVKFRERQRRHFRRCPCAGIPAIVHAADLLYRREFAERNTLRFPWMHSSSVSYLMRGLFKSRFSLYLRYCRKERLGCPPGFHFRLNFISCFHLS